MSAIRPVKTDSTCEAMCAGWNEYTAWKSKLGARPQGRYAQYLDSIRFALTRADAALTEEHDYEGADLALEQAWDSIERLRDLWIND